VEAAGAEIDARHKLDDIVINADLGEATPAVQALLRERRGMIGADGERPSRGYLDLHYSDPEMWQRTGKLSVAERAWSQCITMLNIYQSRAKALAPSTQARL